MDRWERKFEQVEWEHTHTQLVLLKDKRCKVLDAEKFSYKECAIRLQAVGILVRPSEAAASRCHQKEKLE